MLLSAKTIIFAVDRHDAETWIYVMFADDSDTKEMHMWGAYCTMWIWIQVKISAAFARRARYLINRIIADGIHDIITVGHISRLLTRRPGRIREAFWRWPLLFAARKTAFQIKNSEPQLRHKNGVCSIHINAHLLSEWRNFIFYSSTIVHHVCS